MDSVRRDVEKLRDEADYEAVQASKSSSQGVRCAVCRKNPVEQRWVGRAAAYTRVIHMIDEATLEFAREVIRWMAARTDEEDISAKEARTDGH